MFLLPLSGAEFSAMVDEVGTRLTDYEQLTMKFIREGKLV